MTKVRIAIELEKTKNTFFLVPISKVARHYFIVFLNRHIVIDFIDVKPLMLNSFLSNFAVRNEYGIDLKINAMDVDGKTPNYTRDSLHVQHTPFPLTLMFLLYI